MKLIDQFKIWYYSEPISTDNHGIIEIISFVQYNFEFYSSSSPTKTLRLHLRSINNGVKSTRIIGCPNQISVCDGSKEYHYGK